MALDHLWALMVLSDADQYFLYEAIERNTILFVFIYRIDC